MTDIPKIRQICHGLQASKWTTPLEVVNAMGAIQAQQLPMALLAIALRMPNGTVADVEQALDAGEILRTHVLRPTWHIVPAADIRWMLALGRDRLRAAFDSSGRANGLELTPQLMSKALDCIGLSLSGGNSLTRDELAQRLAQADLPNSARYLAKYLAFAEVEGLVCSGRLRGIKNTYMLTDERVPVTTSSTPEEALATLARRYFISHSPATVDDFCWWAGLSLVQARQALALISNELCALTKGSVPLYVHQSYAPQRINRQRIVPLPAYDEYLIAYKNRADVLSPQHYAKAFTNNGIFFPILLSDGKAVGNWQQTTEKGKVQIAFSLFDEAANISSAALSVTKQTLERVLRKNTK